MATTTRGQRLRSNARPLKRAPASPGRDIAGKDDDDLSEELPPLDGISGDEESAGEAGGDDETGLGLGLEDGISAFDDPLETLDEEDDPFDDKPGIATAEDAADDAQEASVGAGPERGWLDESDEASTLDIGDADVAIGDEEEGMLDDSTDPDEDDDEGTFDDAEGMNDGGEEGFDDDDEELREEDLPALDADDDGEVDERSLYEAPESVLDLDPTLPWDRDRDVWTLEALSGASSASASAATFECVAAHGSRRFAAGSELRVYEADGRASSIKLPAPVARIAIGAGADVWMLTFDGSILRGLASEDAAATTVEAIATWPLAADAPGAVDIAYSAHALWVLDANDDLWISRDGAATWSREAQHVLAIAADEAEEQLVVIAMDRTGALRELDIARPGARSVALPFATHAALPGASSLSWGLALRGRSKLAFAHGAGAWRSVDGAAWARLPSSAETFAATWLEDGSVLLALGEVEGEREPVKLARAEPRGLLTLVAELAPGEELANDGQVALALGHGIESDDMACGATVVGPFGVRVLKRGAKRH